MTNTSHSAATESNRHKSGVLTVIDADSDLDFLWRSARSVLGFRARAALNWLRKGHVVRQRAIAHYLAGEPNPRLHLGATVNIPGILNSQILGDVPIDVTRPLPFPDRSLALIYSSHLVEHIHRQEFHRFLAEGARVLRPGGLMLVAAPSIEKIARVTYGGDEWQRQLLMKRCGEYFHDNGVTTAHEMNLAMRAFGHRFLYDTAYMQWIAPRAGYAEVRNIGNFEVPDEGLRAYLHKWKPPRWDVQTETWAFVKANPGA